MQGAQGVRPPVGSTQLFQKRNGLSKAMQRWLTVDLAEQALVLDSDCADESVHHFEGDESVSALHDLRSSRGRLQPTP